jgi:hypothetical protein
MTEPDTETRADLDPEDRKLLTLARGAMGRTGGVSGAALRDVDGRTYAAGAVELSALRLSALQAAVAAAVSSGAEGFEAAAMMGAPDASVDPGVAAVREVSSSARIISAGRDGAVLAVSEPSR